MSKTILDKGVQKWYGGGRSGTIKLVQEVTAKITGTNDTLDVTISDCNVSNTMLIYQVGGGSTPTDYDANAICVRVTQTSRTNIRLIREHVTSGDSITVHVKVVTFKDNKVKIQTGTIALLNVTTNTATITSVNTAKAFALYLGCSCGDNDGSSVQDGIEYMAAVDLTNATTVTATIITADTADTITVGYMVVEER